MDKLYITCFGINPDRYIAYSDGRIYDTYLERFKSTHIDKDGYHYISFEIDNHKHKKFRLNRVICQTFHPITNCDEYHANHINGDVDDNSASNLNWLTPIENNHHSRYELHHERAGEDHPLNKYSEELVHEICISLEKGLFRSKDIINDIETRTGNMLVIINKESFQNLIMSIRNKSRWSNISNNYKIQTISIYDEFSYMWNSNTIERVCEMIADGFSNKQISMHIFGRSDKNIRDYVYRIRSSKAFREISKKYW